MSLFHPEDIKRVCNTLYIYPNLEESRFRVNSISNFLFKPMSTTSTQKNNSLGPENNHSRFKHYTNMATLYVTQHRERMLRGGTFLCSMLNI